MFALPAVHPRDWSSINGLVEAVPRPFWKLLQNRFGGGPEVRFLRPCPSCLCSHEEIVRRQCREMNAFIIMNEKFNSGNGKENIFAVSTEWFRIWQKFVCGDSEEIPGPIDNRHLMEELHGDESQNQVMPNTDYVQLSSAMWKFLYDIYGGGPAVEFILSESSVTKRCTKNAL